MPNLSAQETLCQIIATYGRDLSADPRRLEAMLRDQCGSRREINLLMSAQKEGVAGELLTASAQALPRELLLSRLAQKMQDDLGLTTTAARWAVESWALSFGLISPDQRRIVSLPPLNAADVPGAPSAPGTASPDKRPDMPISRVRPVSALPPGPAPAVRPHPSPTPTVYATLVNGGMILTLGLLSFFCLGIFLGPLAWVMGSQALAAMDRGEADPTQRGMVIAGRLCGALGAVASILWIIGIVQTVHNHS